jgi:outer membrane protein OmpA-like peptidoglycan-associated protein
MLKPSLAASLALLPLAILHIAASSHPMEVRDATRVLLTGDIIFKTNSAALDLPKSEAALKKVAAAINKLSPDARVRIGVHSDTRGSDTYNLRMSQDRAASVARWLVSHDISCARLIPTGFGESRPLTKKLSKNKNNRRVEIISLSADADAADGGALAEWRCE